MRSIRKAIIGLGLLTLAVILHAQLSVQSFEVAEPASASDSIVQLTAEANGLARVAPADLPRSGTFWQILPDGLTLAPMPCPPLDASLPIFQITTGQFIVDATGGQVAVNPHRYGSLSTSDARAAALTAQAESVVNLINQVQEAQFEREFAMEFGMDEEMTPELSESFSPLMLVVDPDGLYLEITNVSQGWSHLNLCNATNLVYAIWSKTNLLTGWQVETELWPTTNETSVLPFTLPTLNRQNWFVRAEDWTDKDSNGDGLPDWYAWKYFGDFNESATNDYDGDGVSNLQEYLNGTDPNKIVFDMDFPNLRFNTGNASGTFSISNGVPAKMAVLVDNMNFTTANWVAYSSNFSVNLGTVDGTHQVWIGLKGRATDSTATWEDWSLTRDTVPPLVVVTNPVVTTLSQPVIQLQGYSVEPLSSLRYAISNATGLLTNQEGYITHQWVDTNLLEVTTNWFICQDISLTNGLNTIWLYATDQAGNVSTNTYAFTLDYSGDTTPPVMGLYWPQPGDQIEGSNFTLRGSVDDATAQMTVQIVNTNGETNSVNALIERNGNVWAENLPLAPGTNTVTLTATDAAGNSSVTNLQVIQGDASLTIDPLPVDQLNNPTITVTGTIGVSGYTVWVNGVKATDNGNGTWTAEAVPVNEGGTAVVEARAIPNSDNGGNGSGGSGGSGSGGSSGNPSSAQQKTGQTAADKAAELVAVHYDKDRHFEDGDIYSDYNETENMVWNLKKPGQYTFESCWNQSSPGDNRETYVWYEYDWNDKAVGTLTSVYTRSTGTSPPACGDRSRADVISASAPGIGSEKCSGGDLRMGMEVDGTQFFESVKRKTLTLYELHTGGKAGSKRKNLFVVNASATKLYNLFYPESDGYSPTAPIASAKIKLGDLGSLGNDGYLVKVLGNGETHDATPTVSSTRYYSYPCPAGHKYQLKSQVFCAALTDTNLERTSLGVGEYVNLGFVPAVSEPVGPVTYTTTAGTIDSGGNFIAPHTAATATVTATVRGEKLSIDFGVVEPNGVDHADLVEYWTYNSTSQAGAGMHLRPYIGPTSVSFSAVQIMEVGENASDIQGYFATHTPPNHDYDHGANHWISLNCNNSWENDYDWAQSWDWSPPWFVSGNSGFSGGSYTYNIPAKWRVGSGSEHSMAGWNQVHILSANGTMSVTKFGHTVSRTINNVYSGQ